MKRQRFGAFLALIGGCAIAQTSATTQTQSANAGPSQAAAAKPAKKNTRRLQDQQQVVSGHVLVTSETPGEPSAAEELVWSATDKRLSVGTTSGSSTLSVTAPSADTTVASFGRNTEEGTQTLVEVRTQQTVSGSGNEVGRGAIRLIDNVAQPARTMELGFYEYGGGLFTDHLLELWTRGVSIRDTDASAPPFLAVRDQTDSSDLRLRHDGNQGIIETTGAAAGGIRVGGSGPVTLSSNYGTVAVANDFGRFLIGAVDDETNMLQVGGPAAIEGNVRTKGDNAGFRFGPRFGWGDWQWWANVGNAYLYDHNNAVNRLTVHGEGMSVAGEVDATSYKAGGVAGLNQVITVRTGDDSGTCTLTVTQGLITATTCP